MKKLLLLLTLFSSCTFAIDYKMILPYGPGSQSDGVNRSIAEKFHELTGDNIIIENKANSNGAVAINYFKLNKDVDLIALGSGILVSDPALKEMVYSDSDFDHLFYVGTSPFFWFTGPKSTIKTIDDLLKNAPEFTGSNSDTGKINTNLLAKETSKAITFVSYKDSPAVIVAVMSGEIPAGNTAATKSLLELHKAGKLTIVGSSFKEDFIVDGIRIPSIVKRTSLEQFNGFMSVAVRPDMNPERKQKLKEGLWKAIHDPEVRERAKISFVMPDEYDDMKVFNKFIQTTRNNMKKAMQ